MDKEPIAIVAAILAAIQVLRAFNIHIDDSQFKVISDNANIIMAGLIALGAVISRAWVWSRHSVETKVVPIALASPPTTPVETVLKEAA